MKFKVTRDVLNLGLKIIGITITNLDNKTETADYLKFKDKAYEALKQKYQGFDIETDLILKGFNELHKKVGIKRRKNIPVSESILKRFLKEGKVSVQGKLNNLYNIITLDSRLSIGMHDIDKINGNVTLNIAKQNQPYIPIEGEEKIINKGEYVYTDSKDIIYKLEVKQSKKTVISENTKNVFITIEGNEATSAEYLLEVAGEVIDLITTYCGGTAQIIYK